MRIPPCQVIGARKICGVAMGIIAGRAPAVNRGYDRRRVEEARNFCNKLWNIARYIQGLTVGAKEQGKASPASPADHWILAKLHALQQGLEQDMNWRRPARNASIEASS